MSSDEATFRPRGLRRQRPALLARAQARAGYRVFADEDGFEAAVPCEVLARMLALGRRARPAEWLGLLVGRVCEDERGPHVVVAGVVVDPDATAGPHAVASTAASEAATRANARTLFPDARPLGWAHGHLGHGAFFSDVDRRNQATWTAPHALGIVVDPWSTPQVAVYRGPTSVLLHEVAGPAAAPVVEAPDVREASARDRALFRPRWRRLARVAGVLAILGFAQWAGARSSWSGEVRPARLGAVPDASVVDAVPDGGRNVSARAPQAMSGKKRVARP